MTEEEYVARHMADMLADLPQELLDEAWEPEDSEIREECARRTSRSQVRTRCWTPSRSRGPTPSSTWSASGMNRANAL
ncbi:hypothetical protein ACFQX7_07125 [Luedemannella flava]